MTRSYGLIGGGDSLSDLPPAKALIALYSTKKHAERTGTALMLLADTSAWHHSGNEVVAAAWRANLERDEIAMCGPVRLEVLYSAKSADDYTAIAEELDALHQLPCDQADLDRALDVHHALAQQGGLHHRSVKLVDLMIAAIAERADATVWHYDSDYDRVAEVTGQPIQWIAARGTL